jgi:hypothetical protein
MANNIADLVRREPGIDTQGKVMKPELGFPVASSDMDVGRLARLVRIEKGPVRSPTENSRHRPTRFAAASPNK